MFYGMDEAVVAIPNIRTFISLYLRKSKQKHADLKYFAQYVSVCLGQYKCVGSSGYVACVNKYVAMTNQC